MRPTALIPALCCVVALVLSFLCLFAGHKKGFMEDYHYLTLNTSRIGQNLVNSTLDLPDNPFTNLINNVTSSFGNEINDATADLAEALGIEDWYSAHLLDYCYGDYTPAALANATVKQDDIHKNISGCSNRTAAFAFNPTTIIENALNESGVDVSLQDLNWPDDIQRGIDALRILTKTMFILYCIAIGFIGVSLLAALPAVFASGRLAACLNILVATLAFIAIGLASALSTAVIVKGADVINKYGQEVGVEAHKGSKFMAITWAATAAMFVALVLWCVETCIGHRRRRGTYVAKHG
ncbi:integral membrane protein-like protein [Polyplosphaeria fusca]|uniref:Integral membrane protein-like protein n=1 Tax=Polyplosphaeria fusca TaxID=682080 RepID=A0A9P4V5U8_9PLEO|nr:integral membrane protein-like protein [Polyplosphaeria fusca]